MVVGRHFVGRADYCLLPVEVVNKGHLKGGKMKNGFSLTEILLAIGVLVIGMLFIAGVFPVAIHFSTMATEETIAAIVADEAFAKIKIYALGDLIDYTDDIDISKSKLRTDKLTPVTFTALDDVFPAARHKDTNLNEFAYPSTDTDSQKQYYWSALCRLTEEYNKDNNPNPLMQVTVFISRKVNQNLKYRTLNGSDDADWPMPIKVKVEQTSLRKNELRITSPEIRFFINDGYIIVDNKTGRIYRVLERYATPKDDIVLLDRYWDGRRIPLGSSPILDEPEYIWVIPSPINGGRNPCINIYQKIIGF